MKNQRSTIYIIILSVICIALIIVSHYVPSITMPIRNVFSSVIVPIQSAVNKVGMYFVDNSKNYSSLKLANERIRFLEEQVASLSTTNNMLRSQSYEVERLRDLYKLSDEYDEYDKVAARIISKETDKWFQVFKIDKGSKDGMKVDMNVLSNKGLCGIITSVGYNYSIVRSIIDDESRVSAMTQHSYENCMIEGSALLYDKNLLVLSGIELSSTIVEGDKIVTANISSKYLPNILIGFATDISVNENQLSKKGYVIPVTDFSNLTEVLVITRLKSDSMKDD